jgi:tetratricopeptide (TPR) repeat protein
MGAGHFSAGDFPSTIECLKRAIQVRADPIYCQTARMYLGIAYFSNGQLLEAEEAFKEVEAFSRDFGIEWVGTPAQAFLGILLIAKGQMNQGLRMVEDAQREFVENGRKWFLALSHYAMGKLYLQLVEGSAKVSFSVALKNIGFLVKNVPFAKRGFNNEVQHLE